MANSDGESGSDNAEMTNSKHEYVTQESTRLDVELPVLEDMITPNDDGRSLGSEIPDSEADLASSSPVKESPVAISEGQEAVEDTPANIEMPVEGTSGVQNERMKDVIDCEIGNLEMWKNSDGEDVQAALESRSSVVISDEQSESTALGTEVFMKFTREGPRAMEDAASPTVVDSESDSSTANTTDTEVKLSSSGGQSLLTNEGPTPADDTPLTVETSSSLATLNDVGNGDYDMLMDTSEKLLGSGQLVLEMLGPKDRLSTEEEDVQSIQYHIKMDQTSLVLNEVLTTFQSPETDHIPNDFSAPKAQRTDRDGDKQPSQTSKSEAPSLPCKPDSSRVPEPNNQPSQNPSSAINPIPSLSASTKSPSSLDVSPSRPDGFQNKDVVMAELKNMKMASIQARNAALEAQITNQRARLEQVSKDLRYPAAETVKRHIKLLHDYNDIRDVGQGLIGMIADNRGVRIGELYDEFGVGLND